MAEQKGGEVTLYKVWGRFECEYYDIEADRPEEAFHIASDAAMAGGNGKTFLLAGIGDIYGVNVKKEGYTGKHITIVNNKRPNCDGRTGRESSRLKFIGNK